jgi:hypothetical protein
MQVMSFERREAQAQASCRGGVTRQFEGRPAGRPPWRLNGSIEALGAVV